MLTDTEIFKQMIPNFDARKIQTILNNYREKRGTKSKIITQNEIIYLLEKKGHTFISLLDPTGDRRDLTITYKNWAGREYTTLVRSFLQSVNGRMEGIREIYLSQLSDEIDKLYSENPGMTKLDIANLLNISTVTFKKISKLPKGHLQSSTIKKEFSHITPREEHMVKIATYSKLQGKPYACLACELQEWDTFHITEFGILDHIDGNRDNNDPQNIRVLCPNCNQQTKTRFKSISPDPIGTKPNNIINLFENDNELSEIPYLKDRLLSQGVIPKKREGSHKKPLINVENSTIDTLKPHVITDRLIGEGKLQPICSECKLKSWRNLSMRLFFHSHHINGDEQDNSPKNLELLCPNCHRLEHLHPYITNPDGTITRQIDPPQCQYDPNSPNAIIVHEALLNRGSNANILEIANTCNIDVMTFRAIGLSLWPELWPTRKEIIQVWLQNFSRNQNNE